MMKSKEIPNPKYYEVRKDGTIYSYKSNRLLTQILLNGYKSIAIKTGDKTKSYQVHRLVALKYIKNPENKPYVNHINENKKDNRVENLEWVTQKENCERHGKVTSHARQVIQMDLKGNVIQIHNSVTQAMQNTISLTAKTKNTGVDRSTIKKVCTGEQLTAGGYKWAYVNEENKPINIDLSKGKPIQGYSHYIAFPDGKIVSVRKKNTYLLRPTLKESGYSEVTLCKPGTLKQNFKVHRIIAATFIPPKDKKKTHVVHKNRNRNDNRVENLEWVSPGNTNKYANRSS